MISQSRLKRACASLCGLHQQYPNLFSSGPLVLYAVAFVILGHQLTIPRTVYPSGAATHIASFLNQLGRHLPYSRLLTIRICRFLSHTIHTRILNPAFLPVVLRTLRATLFPNNALGAPRQIPSDEEAQAIKHRCAATLLDLVPPKVAAAFFATYEHEKQIRQIEDTLSSLDDPYLNKHLVFQIVELIVLRLFPELGERGVKELLEERIN